MQTPSGVKACSFQRGLAHCGALVLAITLLACARSEDKGDWPLNGHDIGGQRYSALTAIDTGTVAGLVPKWTYHSGVAATFQATPIVVDGVMYVSLPFSGVVALDPKTGHEVWRYKHESRVKKLCCGPTNRGVAVSGGKVYLGTVDGRLLALDAKTGTTVWDVTVAEYQGTTEVSTQLKKDDPLARLGTIGQTGVAINAAPLVYDGKVFVGITGVGYGLHLAHGLPVGISVVGVSGEYGRPGMMAAFDAETGKVVWEWDVTGPGWEGEFRGDTPDGVTLNRDLATERAEAPKFADAWKYGGGSIYVTPVVDTERNLLIFGTGNPSPQMADDSRPGDNLYTSSLVALDLRTGKLAWYYQQVPHDRWNYDVANSPVLLDLKYEGQQVPAVAQAGKTGWVYVHDRRDGRLLFKSDAFVLQHDMFTPPKAGEGIVIAPGADGGANWSPSAYDSERQLFYVAAMHMPTRYIAHEDRLPDGSMLRYTSMQNTDDVWGTLTALDLGAGGRLRWQVKTDEPMVGGLLATAGGLVFSGIGKGVFAAFDANSGNQLWSYQGDAGVNAPPITYSVDGKQYVAVAIGGNSIFGFKLGDEVVAFGLPE
jgi:glucose dehydrogenase